MHIGLVTPFSSSDISFIISKPWVGIKWGRETHVIALLAQTLINAGNRVSLYGFERDIFETQQGQEGGLSWTVVPHRKKMSMAMLDSFAWERRVLVPELLKNKPDILHAHWTQYGHALAALDSNILTMVTAHDAAKECAQLNRGGRPIAWFCNSRAIEISSQVLRRSKYVSAVSPYVKKHLRREFDYAGEVRVIPNMILQELEISKKRDGVLTDPIFISIGHWGALKNMKMLLRSFRIVKQKLPKSRLVLVGRELGMNDAAQVWARKKGFLSGVEFVGALSHDGTMEMLRKSDILVHVSRSEGFGLTLCEALSCGVAVVAGEVGAMPWVLNEGWAGLLVDPMDENQVADAMLQMAGDSELRATTISCGEDQLGSLFGPRYVVDQYLKYYMDILESE